MCANDAALWYRQELSVALKTFLVGRFNISLLEIGAKFAFHILFLIKTLSPEVHKINQVLVQIFSCLLFL